MFLLPLGTNGYFPASGRHTACYLVHEADTWILLDAGTGVGRLADPGIRQHLPRTGADLHVLLSHYHMDHISGLIYLPAVWPQGRIILHLPGPPFVDATPATVLEGLFRAPFAQSLHEGFKGRLEVHPLTRGEERIGGLPCRFWPQRHPGGSTGMRLGTPLVYATDRAPDPLPEAARDAALLLHEVWMTDAEAAESPESLDKHCAASHVARIAREARCHRLVPIHHAPTRSADELESMRHHLQLQSDRPCLLAREGTPLPLVPE